MAEGSNSRRSTIPWQLVAIVTASLAVKLSLIGWNRGEYTDGIIQLHLWDSPVVFFPPLYTILVHLLNLVVGNPLISGRLVSILASSLVPIALFYTARRLGDEQAGLWAALLWVLSPMQNRWGLRVMTDSLFTLFFTIALLYYIDAVLERRDRSHQALRGMFFWTGVATLTRYHGLAVFALTLPLLRWQIKYRKKREPDEPRETGKRFAWPSWLVLIPWVGLGGWLIYRGFGHFGQFADRASHGLLITGLSYFNHLEGYILYLPWAIGYPLAILPVFVVIKMKGQWGPWGLVRVLTLFLLAIWLIVQTGFQSFQFRYFLPLLPLFCLLGGYGIRLITRERLFSSTIRTAILFLLIAWPTVLSVLVVGLQRDAFGDITDAAFFVSDQPAEVRVYSNEWYRADVGSVKMSFWSGRAVYGYHPGLLDQLRAGDLVALHNVYGQTDREIQILRSRFGTEVVFRSRRLLYPLLPDIMAWPPGATSNPIAMAYRFMPQEYETVVVRLTAPLDSRVPSP